MRYIDRDGMPHGIYNLLSDIESFGHPGVDGNGMEQALALPRKGKYTDVPDQWEERFNHVKLDFWPDYQQLLYIDKWGRTFGWDQWEKMNLTTLRERKVIIEQKLGQAKLRANRLEEKDMYSGLMVSKEHYISRHRFMVITMQEGLARINSIIDRKVERMNRR